MAIIVLGDSNSQGFFDHEKGGWVERLKQHMFKENGSFVFNLGVSGFTSNSIIELINRGELDSRIEADDEDVIIIVAIGTNDSSLIGNEKNFVSNIKFMSNIAEIYRILKEKYTKTWKEDQRNDFDIMFIGPPNVDESRSNPVSWDERLCYNNEQIGKYSQFIKDFCDPTATRFLNLFEKFKFETSDGVHLLPSEHEQIFQEVLKAVNSIYD